VLTNAHVVASATSMDVMLSDGRSEQATLVGSLPDDDIALIRVTDATGLTPAELGVSADVKVGDDVVAIGNALNLGGPPSVTEGIISATDRSIQAQDITLDNLIQTDAAINPGNSGGPLLNADGQVVAINTAIIDTAQNIGFAIAIDSIKPLIDEIKNGQATVTPDSAFLGVSTKDVGEVTPEVLTQYGVKTSDGAFVVDIQPGSAAGSSGLQLGDVITAIDGRPMTGSQDVIDAVRGHQAGDEVTVTFERDGQIQSLVVRLGSRATTTPTTN
jgi:S1-C subfamily serine protease